MHRDDITQDLNRGIAQQYDILAGEKYDNARVKYYSRIGRIPQFLAIELLRKSFEEVSKLDIVDIGCGMGHDMTMFPQIVELVYGKNTPVNIKGCDLSSEMVAICQRVGLDVLQADALDFIKQIDQVHLIWAHLSLIHLPSEDFRVYVPTLISSLVPGGIIAVGFKTGDDEERIDPADERLPLDRFTAFHRIETVQRALMGNDLTIRATLDHPNPDDVYTYAIVYAQKGVNR